METRLNDIVLIYHEKTLLSFARVEKLEEDVKRGWWRITLLLLKLPLQYVTWILREEYIDGQQFTMAGEIMRLERLPRPGLPGLAPGFAYNENSPVFKQGEEDISSPAREKGKVIALRPRQCKDKDQGN
jgi:hypothetical protein